MMKLTRKVVEPSLRDYNEDNGRWYFVVCTHRIGCSRQVVLMIPVAAKE